MEVRVSMEANAEAVEAPSVPDAPTTPEEAIARLEADLTVARSEAAANWDKFLRERADVENTKRRLERAFADQLKRQQKGLLGKFLGVVDNLDRALAYAEGGVSDPERLVQGVRLTQTLLRDTLHAEGVRDVPAEGQPFDPAVHEAIASEVRTDVPEGHVVAELQRGYLFGDELLRAAMVRVAASE
jgi:molecular chaperone GrpE